MDRAEVTALIREQTRQHATLIRQLQGELRAVGSFRAQLSANANPASGDTVVFDNDSTGGLAYDTDGWFDTATGRYTPQREGYYWFFASTYAVNQPTATSQYWQTRIRRGILSFADNFRYAPPSLARYPVACGAAVYMNGTTDYAHVVRVSSFADTTIDNSAMQTYFTGFRVGAGAT